MVRTYLAAGIIFIALIVGSIWHKSYLNEATTSLEAQLLVMEEEIQQKNWENTNIMITNIENEWQEKRRICNILLDHRQIDNIDITLERLKRYIIGQDDVLSLGEVAALRLYVNRISDIEKISLENIF